MLALGYIRVSTADQVDSGAGLEAQRTLIAAECARRGWDLEEVHEGEAYSAKNLRRPAIQAALDRLACGEADALIAAKLDRLSRSVGDFSTMMSAATKQNWALIVLDCGADTSTPAGKALGHMLATFAQYEREIIGQRTREALAVKKAEGIKIGRPRTLDPAVRERIVREHGEGYPIESIARQLNLEGVPTAHGGKRWYHATVSKIVRANDASLDPYALAPSAS